MPGDDVTILLAEDDPDDRMLTTRALERNGLNLDVRTVADGEELMDYLHRRGAYVEEGSAPKPALILLDLNMPRKDGREALAEIKGDPALRRIPVVVLTTSEAEQDIRQSYELGVNAFVSKPVTFEKLSESIELMGRFWLEVVKLPS
jgi:CheY-like chemotaxis protein